MSAAEARAEWLRQELLMLQLRMEREARQSGAKLQANYWKDSFTTAVQPRDGSHGSRGDSRALHGCGAGDNRAMHGCGAGDSRALHDCGVGSSWNLRDGGFPGDQLGFRGSHEGDDHEAQGVPRGRDKEEGDGLKATTIVLPTLATVGVDAGLQCGDWLAQVRPLIGDMATNALDWWDSMMEEVSNKYQVWLAASPLERLRVSTPDERAYNKSAGRQRMDLRASGLLMQALPANLREELVSARCLTSGKILFRILQNYQPGGTSERTNTLQELTTSVPATDSRDAVTKLLRRWRRHQQRAEELQVTQPDGTLMHKSLTTLVSTVLGSAPQANFRINAFRMQSRVDINPTVVTLQEYYTLLLAEMETLVLAPEVAQDGPGQKPAIRAVAAAPGGGPLGGKGTKSNVCRSWGTEQGSLWSVMQV